MDAEQSQRVSSSARWWSGWLLLLVSGIALLVSGIALVPWVTLKLVRPGLPADIPARCGRVKWASSQQETADFYLSLWSADALVSIWPTLAAIIFLPLAIALAVLWLLGQRVEEARCHSLRRVLIALAAALALFGPTAFVMSVVLSPDC